MTSITIALSEDRLEKLEEIASRLGIMPEELVLVSIEELLTRPAADFERAADHLLAKNADLYQQLATVQHPRH